MASTSNGRPELACEADELNQNAVASIQNFLKSNAKKIESCDKKKIVFVLGNTCAGKTTLVSLITKVNLNSKETVKDSGEYMITDEKHLISGMSTTVSETMCPNLMVHEKTGTSYYDCPGFNDSRGVDHDISVSFFTRQLIEKCNEVKFVFAIDYKSVQNGIGDRHGFSDLAKHATTFIKNIDKYKDGIALIVTKVENRYEIKNGQLHLIKDAKIIETIVIFIQQMITDLAEKNSKSSTSLKEEEMNKRKIQFLNILLKRNNRGQFERITILRLANEAGPVANIKVLQNERRIIKEMIHEDLSYVKKNEIDFGYTVSNESRNKIHELMGDMQVYLENDVQSLGYEIKQFYLKLETDTVDINVLLRSISVVRMEMQKIVHHDQLERFGNEFMKLAIKLNINISFECKRSYECNVNLVKFLHSVSNIQLPYSFQISGGLNDLLDYLEKSYNWYNLLLALHDNLSTYEVQNNKAEYFPRCDKIIRQCNTQEYSICKIDDIDLKQLAKDVGCEVQYNALGNIRLNSMKLNALKLVLKQTLEGPIEIDRIDEKLVIKGYNVKISDVIGINAHRFIAVFALNNLFIDVDIIKIGQNAQVSFIAPKWYIIGDRQINLDGKDGEPHSCLPLEESQDGIPGRPGGAGGNFLGIGKKSFCSQNLKIHLNGGKGGPGQDGAKGKDGNVGETPPTPKWFISNPWRKNFQKKKTTDFNWLLFGRNTYKFDGKTGTEPSDGGKGGHGGIGGNAGKCPLVCFDIQPKFVISKNKGDDGYGGKGGVGGKSANGDDVEAEYIQFLYFLEFSWNVSKNPSKIANRSGQNGDDSGNIENIERPAQLNSFNNKVIMKEYVDYMTSKMMKNVQESVLSEFMNELKKDSVTSALETVKQWNLKDLLRHRKKEDAHKS